jgi:hypothetical protein
LPGLGEKAAPGARADPADTDADGSHDGDEFANEGDPPVNESAATLIVTESVLAGQ